jgi:hypothetical protein
MTPSDLVPLYVPILICWFLIQLTRAAEGIASGEERDRPADPASREASRKTHVDGFAASARQWNVSHFFGYG